MKNMENLSPLKTYLQLMRTDSSHAKTPLSKKSKSAYKNRITPTRYERERAAMKNKPRKVLNLEERVLAIRLYHANPVYQRVASIFKCSWEQIRNVIANRDDILRYYGECQTVNPKDSSLYVRNKKINFLGNVTFEFIKRAYFHQSATLNDEVIRKRAIQFRDILRIDQFHPNKAWIADFKKVYNIDWENLDSLVICGTPHRSLECKDLIDYCTRMVSKAVALIEQVPKQLTKKETKNDDFEEDEYEEGSGGGHYGDNEYDSMLVDNYDDVPVVNEVDDYAGMYLSTTGNNEEDEINEDEDEGPQINYAEYDGSTDEILSNFYRAKTSASTALQQESVPESTTQLLTEVQIKQERRSRSKSPQLLSPLTVTSGTSANGGGVKRKTTDETLETAAELMQSVNREPVNSYTEAMRALAPLEEFVTQQEDFHAINLLTQLTHIFEKGVKRKRVRRNI